MKAGTTASLTVRTVTEWAADPNADVSFITAAASQPSLPPVQAGLFDEPTADVAAPEEGPQVSIVDVREPGKVGGARFGELVHALLATAPLGGSRADFEDVAVVQARILGAPDTERDAAVDAALRVSRHDLLVRAAAADARGEARRECPVTFTARNGLLLEGIVDLAFVDEGRWVVVDFKTDREISHAGEARYTKQVALYAAAIERATGQRAEAALVRI
ncbi:MAG: PD-(D/E)XK nuclease family protein [Vicinamibacterales bacterium]